MQDPLKQGLKLKHYRINSGEWVYSNARSTKTRIEADMEISYRKFNRIRMQDPLKQGLKLECDMPEWVTYYPFECKIH